VRFIEEFLDSEYRVLIARYGRSPGVSAVRRLEAALAGRGASRSLDALIVTAARVKRALGR
jgi:hypothetical protein